MRFFRLECGFDEDRVNLYENKSCFAFLFPPYAGNSAEDIHGLTYLGKIRLRGLVDHHMTLSDRPHSLFEEGGGMVKPYSKRESPARKIDRQTWPD